MAKSNAGGAPFAKDLGYLDRFLVGVTNYAASAEGERGESLRRLLDGEIERWNEIGALLRGETPTPSAPPPRAEGPSSAFGLTVGSLRRRVEPQES